MEAPLVSFLPDLITNIMRYSLIDTKLNNSAETRYEVHNFVILYLTILPFPPKKDIFKKYPQKGNFHGRSGSGPRAEGTGPLIFKSIAVNMQSLL
jgi:hypothetical protein